MSIKRYKQRTVITKGKPLITSECVIISQPEYTTEGEEALLVTDIEHSTIRLNSQNTDHITIKAMTDVKIVGDVLIDDEYTEIDIEKFASVELRFFGEKWYIMSSDGLKDS
jgi:hypothetical protein